jgi:hypothetical protein
MLLSAVIVSVFASVVEVRVFDTRCWVEPSPVTHNKKKKKNKKDREEPRFHS